MKNNEYVNTDFKSNSQMIQLNIKSSVPLKIFVYFSDYGRGNDRIDYEVITNDSDIIYQDEFSEMEDDEEEQDDDDMD